MKTSTLLRRAAKNLWDGGNSFGQSFICVQLAVEAGGRHVKYADRARNRIATLLEGQNTLRAWLVARYPDFPADVKVLQAYRKAWALHLADEFEAKGD